MTGIVEAKLAELGVTLPTPAAAVANYLGYVSVGSLLMTSGQLPLVDGKLAATGLLGRDLDVSGARLAARASAINVLAQAKAALGDLDRIVRLVKITVFVASTPDFTEQHLVANGASDFLVDVLGGAGRHPRSAVGVAALPMNAPVEIEAVFSTAV